MSSTINQQQRQHLLEIDRVSSTKKDFLIRSDEWVLYTEEETCKVIAEHSGKSWLQETVRRLNIDQSDENSEKIIHRLNNRTRILSDIQALLEFANRSFFHQQQKTMLNWILNACTILPMHSMKNTANTNQQARTCIFTNTQPSTILQVQVRVLNTDTASFEYSPYFYCSEEYATIINCLNLLGRFEQFARDAVMQSIEAQSQGSKEEAQRFEQQLLACINNAARYLFIFFLSQREKKPVCHHALIDFRSID